MPPLVVGSKLVIAKPKGHVDPEYMAHLIVDKKISSMGFTVPTLVSIVFSGTRFQVSWSLHGHIWFF